MLKLARVVDVHPESHSVDVVVMDDNRRFSGVRVMAFSGGSDYGIAGLAVPTNTGFDAKNSDKRDIFAVVGWLGYSPVVLGFIHPQISQLRFPDKNRMVYRHPSDVYMTVDADGNAELHHPSGAFIRLGTSPAHEDLSGKDVDSIWSIERNTDKAVHIHIEQAGDVASVDIAPNGAITLHTGSTLTASVDGGTTWTTPDFQINGNLAVSGNATFSGDSVTHGGKNIGKTHTHGGVKAGADHSAAPD